MNKKELIAAVSEKIGLGKTAVAEIISATFDTIIEKVKEEGRVIFDGNKFVLKTLAKRVGRNPKTGEAIEIPEKKIISYRKQVD